MSGFFGFLAFTAFVAFIIGMIKPQIMVFWGKKKTRGMACLYLVAMLIFIIIAASNSSSTPAASQPSASATSNASVSVSKAASVASAKPALKSYSAELASGFYTVGIDFPAGTYTLTAVKDGGNVSTNDGSLNIIMGTKKDDMYQKEYKNAEFSDGTILSLAGVTVKIASKNDVNTALKKRTNTATKSYTLSAGNYKAGEDVEAGTYDLTAVKGGGNVSTDSGSLNTIMGTKSDSMYQKQYKNVELKDAVKLSITGVTVKLVPSK